MVPNMDILMIVNTFLDDKGNGRMEFKMKRGCEAELRECLYNVANTDETFRNLLLDVSARIYSDIQKKRGLSAS